MPSTNEFNERVGYAVYAVWFDDVDGRGFSDFSDDAALPAWVIGDEPRTTNTKATYMSTRSYRLDAQSDAKEMAKEFISEIAEQLENDGEASRDLYNDYNGGSYHHESHIDKDYSLWEAATLLDELSEYSEDDSSLWEGLEPRRAVAAMAAYTYGNAVYSMWVDLIEEINSEFDEEDEDYINDAESYVRELIVR